MSLDEVKRQIFALIEELNPENAYLTDDPDLSSKINYVINQIQFFIYFGDKSIFSKSFGF